jgi:Acyl-CoA synthetases (AMP-forming)/AMP-acid ligases II
MLPEHKGYEGNIYVDYYVATMREFPKRQAITCLTENRTFTYGEFDKITNQLDHRFRQAGLKKDDVVMVCLFNTWQFPMLLLGAWKTPCIFSPINFRLAPGEIAIIIDDSKPKVFVWDSVVDELIKRALELSKHNPPVLLCTGNSTVEGAINLEDYYKDAPDEDQDIEDRVREILDPFQDEILRHYTSGTTGLPKGTVQSCLVTMQMDWALFNITRVDWYDKGMGITPWFHQGGLLLVTMILLAGGHLFCFPLTRFDPDVALDYVERYKLTTLFGAPPPFDALAAAQQKKTRDLSSLRLVFTMGAPFSREEYQAWSQSLCKTIVSAGGTTETRGDYALSSYLHPMESKAGFSGRRPLFCQLRVIKARPGERVEPNETAPRDGKTEGELISKSSHQFLHYYNRPDDDAKHLYKGWFYSGDVATWDEEGFITIKGRTDDMIQSGAEKVYPVPVEECLMRHPKVQDVFVIPLPHERWGQAVAAYVLPKEGETLTVEELDKHCREDPFLADYTRPRYYQIVGEQFPYTPTGKKMHYILADKAKEEIDKFIPIPSQRG